RARDHAIGAKPVRARAREVPDARHLAPPVIVARAHHQQVTRLGDLEDARAAAGKPIALGAQFTISKPSAPAATKASSSAQWFRQYSGSDAIPIAPWRCSTANRLSMARVSRPYALRSTGATAPSATTCWSNTLHSTPGSKRIGASTPPLN